ncbi:MAG: hypothetical protein AB1757_05585 [Acidobacteriota bacterium]
MEKNAWRRCEVAIELVKVGEIEQAFSLLQEAINIIKPLLNGDPCHDHSYYEQVKTLICIPSICAEFGYFEQANVLLKILPEK